MEENLELTSREKKILYYIVKNPGKFQKEICEDLNISKSSLSYHLKKVESLALIIRYKHRKENRVHPTKKAVTLFKNLFEKEYVKSKKIMEF